MNIYDNDRWQEALYVDANSYSTWSGKRVLSFLRNHTNGTIASLRLSCENGCQSCGLLLRQLAIPKVDDGCPYYTICCDAYPPRGGLRVVRGQPQDLDFLQSFEASAGVALRRKNGSFCADGDYDRLPPMELPFQNPSSSQAFAQVRGWIEGCLHQHKKCKPRGSRLPKRVLDLGSLEQDKLIRLRETEREEAPYATLSYCWGQGRTLTTTHKTLRQYEDTGIMLEELPRTLRDAVLVAAQFNFRYLWIDALCIVQGPDGDWAEQSAEMQKIYSDGDLNICAASALHSDEGFLQTLTEDGIPAAQYFWSHDTSAQPRGLIYLWPESPGTNGMGIDLDTQPIDSRAWVLQESLLSPRTVHYTRKGMVWECRRECMAEVDILYRTRSRKTDWQRDVLGEHDRLHAEEKASFSISKANTWGHLVSMYNTLELTHWTDKFPAFAGIAKSYADRYDMTYVAGLWREHFIEGLIWSRDPSVETLSKISDYVAPSWSWASVRGELRCRQECKIQTGLNKVEITDIVVERVGDDFGQIVGAHFAARGILQSVTIETQPPPSHSARNEPFVGRIKQGIEGLVDVIVILDTDMDENVVDMTCHCLYLGDCDFDGSPAPAFLLLRQMGHEAHKYVRIGFAYINPFHCEIFCERLGQISENDMEQQQKALASLWKFSSPRTETITVL